MKTSDFNFDLPEELIAQTPIEPRDHSRLMVLDKATGAIEHRHFYDIIDYLTPADCLVLNDSRVLPARLLGHREPTGGAVEVGWAPLGLSFFTFQQLWLLKEVCTGEYVPGPGDRLLLYAVLSGVFLNLTGSMYEKQLGENGFHMLYFLVVTILLSAFYAVFSV